MEVLICCQQRQVVALSELNQQGINRADLDTPRNAPTPGTTGWPSRRKASDQTDVSTSRLTAGAPVRPCLAEDNTLITIRDGGNHLIGAAIACW